MDSRQLEYFVAVAEELSFTRAAQRTFMVQSTVSAAIRALERDLKTTLFDRSTRKVTLTAAGLALLPEAKAALEAIDRARSVVEEASTGLRGSLRIGAPTSLGLIDLAEVIASFHESYPLVDVQVTTSPTGSSGLADDVRHGRLDVALVGLPVQDLSGLEARRLATVPFVAMVPASHPLATRDGVVALTELAGERFVDMLRGFGNRTTVDRAFDNAGTPRRVHVEVPDLTTVPRYVQAGLGVAVVPELRGDLPGVATLRIIDADLSWTLSAVTLTGRRPSRAVAALLNLLDRAVRSGRPTY